MSKSVVSYIKLKTIFDVQPSRGATDIDNFFQNNKVRIDPIFQECICGISTEFVENYLICYVFQTSPENNSDDSINELLEMRQIKKFDANHTFAILAYLGNEDRSLLEIPKGESKVNIVLGYTVVDNVQYVLYIEHTNEGGVDEIHLHAREVNCWEKETPMVLVVVN